MITNFIGATLQMLYALTYLRFTPDKVDGVGEWREERTMLILANVSPFDLLGHLIPRHDCSLSAILHSR